MEEARAEHLAWCKRRALEYVDEGNLADGVASMMSDLTKHPETACPPVLAQLAILYLMNGDEAGVRRWIVGFR